MSRTPTKAVQMACLTIGYQRVVMPADKAMKVAEAMQHAVLVDTEWKDHAEVYLVREEPLRVEFALVRANQVRMPHGEPTPMQPTRQRLLR